MNKHNNPFETIFQDAPADPHQLCISAALYAVGAQHGQEIEELSEYIFQLVSDVACTAAQAVLHAAHVENDWATFLLPNMASKGQGNEAGPDDRRDD